MIFIQKSLQPVTCFSSLGWQLRCFRNYVCGCMEEISSLLGEWCVNGMDILLRGESIERKF